MAAETQYTANTGIATINVANTSLSGTGNIINPTASYNCWSVLTGASNGTLIKTVTIKAQGSPSQGMIRLWIYNGTNHRLLMEIPVDPTLQSVSDASFEKTIVLNYKLQSTYQLIASTQVADTFNIVAEGLDFAYFTSYVRPESTNYTANTGVAVLATGNTSTAPAASGTVVKVIDATTTGNGTAIESITIKATADISTNCLVRFFVLHSSTYYLLTEVFIPTSDSNGTFPSFEHKIVFPDKFQLKANDSIYATTTRDAAFHIVAEGLDWTYPSTTMSNFTPASVGAVTTEAIVHSLQVPAYMFATGDLLEVYASLVINNNANSKTFKIYINTTSSLGGATLLATYTGTTVIADNFSRTMPVISNTALESYGGATTSFANQYTGNAGTSANITVPSLSAGFYIIISGQKPTSSADTVTVRWSSVTKVI
ncbi:MAG: hypothetical protein ACJ76F_02785 [Bacteroidia bacterium]